jgi:hypothetical protein
MAVEQVTTTVSFAFLPQGRRIRFPEIEMETNFGTIFFWETERRIIWKAFDSFELAFGVDWVY